ncbi:MAG: hypothetical protein K8R11_09705 [Methanococcoides sp.]|nr:hypothetical protein [Methanococcoides sp.]
MNQEFKGTLQPHCYKEYEAYVCKAMEDNSDEMTQELMDKYFSGEIKAYETIDLKIGDKYVYKVWFDEYEIIKDDLFEFDTRNNDSLTA